MKTFCFLPNGSRISLDGVVYIKRSPCDMVYEWAPGEMYLFMWPLTKVNVLSKEPVKQITKECPKSKHGFHRYEVHSPIDTIETCFYCGKTQTCPPCINSIEL